MVSLVCMLPVSVSAIPLVPQELRALGDAVGVVSRGAHPSLIQALPLARYVAPGAEAGGFTPGGAGADVTCRQEEQCVICRMEFEGGEDVKLLPCKHIFHPACLDQWLVINKVLSLHHEHTSFPPFDFLLGCLYLWLVINKVPHLHMKSCALKVGEVRQFRVWLWECSSTERGEGSRGTLLAFNAPHGSNMVLEVL